MILKGIVVDNKDNLGLGRLLVLIPGAFEKAIWCYYGSPIGSPAGGGGFVAIPEPNSEVLVAEVKNHPDQFPEYVWFAVVYSPGSYEDADTFIPKGWEVYKETGIPRKYIFKSPGGNFIEISDTVGDKYNESLIRLKTKNGKTLILDDTLTSSRILISDEKGNGIEITEKGGMIKALANNVHLTAKDGDVLISIANGEGTIQIVNTGSGNIEVETTSGDISMDSGSGNIKLKGQMIEIDGQDINFNVGRVLNFKQ